MAQATSTEPFDLFLFGSTSELIRKLVSDNKTWLKSHTRRLIVSQRRDEIPSEYKDFDVVSEPLDCSDSRGFREGLARVASRHASRDRRMHVFPTYGKFTWNYAKTSPCFTFSDDGFQVNLVSRLQILDAWKPFKANTKFHLFGSLFACFPYSGDYAASMWYVNQIPRHPEYRDLDINVYNIGGCATRFWDHATMPNNPFLHKVAPTNEIFETGFVEERRGVFSFYPSTASRFACWLGRRGVRVL